MLTRALLEAVSPLLRAEKTRREYLRSLADTRDDVAKRKQADLQGSPVHRDRCSCEIAWGSTTRDPECVYPASWEDEI